MADPTLLNGQVTDAVTQSNVKILGESPGMALGTVYQVMAQAVGLGMQNATSLQQSLTTLSTAATNQGINLLYTMDPAVDAVSTQDILTGNSLAQEIAELRAVIASLQQPSGTPVPPAPPSPPGGGGRVTGAGQPPQLPLQPAG
jgi:Killing trait